MDSDEKYFEEQQASFTKKDEAIIRLYDQAIKQLHYDIDCLDIESIIVLSKMIHTYRIFHFSESSKDRITDFLKELPEADLKELLENTSLITDPLSQENVKKIIRDTKVSALEMFAYQGPPSKNWIKTRGQYWEGWNNALDKVLEALQETKERVK